METTKAPLLQGTENHTTEGCNGNQIPDTQLPLRTKSFEYHSDATAKSSIKEKSNLFQAFFTFFKGFIGCGVLTLPYNFYRLGVIPAVIIFTFLGVATWYCMKLCVIVADYLELTKTDFPKVTELVLGKNYKRAMNVMFIFACIVSSTIQAVLAIKFMELFSCELGWEAVCSSQLNRILIVLVIIIPITMVTDVYYLSYPGIAATFVDLSFYLFVMILEIYALVFEGLPTGSFEAQISNVNWSYLPTFFGTQVAAFAGFQLLFEVRGSLDKVEKFHSLLFLVFFTLGTLYIVFGTLGAFIFRPDVGVELLFFSLPKTKLILAFEFIYVLFLPINYGVNLFPAVRLIENFKGISGLIVNKETGVKSKFRRGFIRYAVSGTAFAIALFVPSFNLFLGFIGSFVGVGVGLIFPILLYNKAFADDVKKRLTRKLNWVLLVIWIIMGSFGIIQSLQGIIEGMQ